MVVQTKRRNQREGTTKREGVKRRWVGERLIESADDETGVLHAAKVGDVERIEAWDVVELAAAVDRHGSTALHWAAGSGELETCKVIVARVGGEMKGNKDGRVALHWAARNGRLDVVKWLVCERGVPVDVATKSGNTAVHWAIWGGQLDTLQWLGGEGGGDLGQRNATNCTAAHWGAAKGNVRICEWLFERGVDFSVVNDAGHGVVHKAAWEGNTELCKWFLTPPLSLTSQLTLTDCHGCTPADLAKANGHDSLATVLTSV
eukprot:Sspe_Gene.100521::Locus_75220_Transcript_1_1_Confidence_1.000_Length_841::g.100521::m.100521